MLRRGIVFLLIVFSCSVIAFGQNSSLAPEQFKLIYPVSEINLGIDTRYFTQQNTTSAPRYSSFVTGLSGRYQSSIARYYGNDERKFRIGDLLAAELAAGYLRSDNPMHQYATWFSFRFEAGAYLKYRISENQIWGIQFILLRFANDFVSEYFSGSAIALRYQYKHWVAETGIESRKERIAGYLVPLWKKEADRNQYQATIRYVINTGRTVGLRVEYFKSRQPILADEIITFRIFYGQSF